jgi:TP901-1 family phage major tail protein
MAATGGAGLLVRAYINAVPTTIGGSRQKSVKINNDSVDVTNSDSVGRWQELLGGVAIKKLEVSVSGVLLGTSVDKFVANAAINGTLVQFDVVVPGLGTFSGNFIITDYDIATEHAKEIPFTCTIMSTGVITLT